MIEQWRASYASDDSVSNMKRRIGYKFLEESVICPGRYYSTFTSESERLEYSLGNTTIDTARGIDIHLDYTSVTRLMKRMTKHRDRLVLLECVVYYEGKLERNKTCIHWLSSIARAARPTKVVGTWHELFGDEEAR